MHAELDFIFHAGWKTLGEDDLEHMANFNQIYHDNKDAFLQTPQHGGREQQHFNIPKLHARHHFPDNIHWLGAPYNYSTEISECCHIEIAKKVYKATNPKDYMQQMLLWLTRQEKIYLRGILLQWQLQNWSHNFDADQQFDMFLPQVDEEQDVVLDAERESSSTLSLIQAKQIIPVTRSKAQTKANETSHAVATWPHYSHQ
ncbi:hypothetical protein M422DRAFT_262910 [Sphaerobolus stellatus SS14]|uniref:Uncharacterized protein n=1 Tax=Sphaerobolus stellatus (strain SS14) TaxID=990650 RepID=A0A0C9V045_SPHS4|nr:hypothetical protein M422DRAFT_262910 [Sphaerobolus stellatus SS14]